MIYLNSNHNRKIIGAMTISMQDALQKDMEYIKFNKDILNNLIDTVYAALHNVSFSFLNGKTDSHKIVDKMINEDLYKILFKELTNKLAVTEEIDNDTYSECLQYLDEKFSHLKDES